VSIISRGDVRVDRLDELRKIFEHFEIDSGGRVRCGELRRLVESGGGLGQDRAWTPTKNAAMLKSLLDVSGPEELLDESEFTKYLMIALKKTNDDLFLETMEEFRAALSGALNSRSPREHTGNKFKTRSTSASRESSREPRSPTHRTRSLQSPCGSPKSLFPSHDNNNDNEDVDATRVVESVGDRSGIVIPNIRNPVTMGAKMVKEAYQLSPGFSGTDVQNHMCPSNDAIKLEGEAGGKPQRDAKLGGKFVITDSREEVIEMENQVLHTTHTTHTTHIT